MAESEIANRSDFFIIGLAPKRPSIGAVGVPVGSSSSPCYSPPPDQEVPWKRGRLWIADPRTGERGRDHTQSEAERKEERQGRLAAEVALEASEAANRSLREQLHRLREC